MEAQLNKEQLELVKKFGVDVALYTHDTLAAADRLVNCLGYSDYNPSMLLMDVEQLRESQRALGVVYADDESLDYWEEKAKRDIAKVGGF